MPYSASALHVEGLDLPLSMRLDGPVGEAPLLVFGHGAGAGIDHPSIRSLTEAFVACGIAVLRYQFPFMERQGGAGFGRDAMPVAVATVAAACERGRRLAGDRAVFAGGHSYGGRMTTHAAVQSLLGSLAGLVLLSFPLHGARRPSVERAAHLSIIDLPMLFVSGERDAMAQSPLLEEIVEGCSDARLVRVAGADHGWKAPARIWPDGPHAAVAAAVAAFVIEGG